MKRVLSKRERKKWRAKKEHRMFKKRWFRVYIPATLKEIETLPDKELFEAAELFGVFGR